MTTIADSIPTEDCYSKKELAEEFGLSFGQMDKLVKKAIKERLVQNLTKKVGLKYYYAPQMVEKLKELRANGKLGEVRNRSKASIERNAKLLLQVPVYDEDIVEVLRQAFGTDQNIVKFLTDYLIGTVEPILVKKKQLEEQSSKQIAKELQEKFNVYRQSVG